MIHSTTSVQKKEFAVNPNLSAVKKITHSFRGIIILAMQQYGHFPGGKLLVLKQTQENVLTKPQDKFIFFKF